MQRNELAAIEMILRLGDISQSPGSRTATHASCSRFRGATYHAMTQVDCSWVWQPATLSWAAHQLLDWRRREVAASDVQYF